MFGVSIVLVLASVCNLSILPTAPYTDIWEVFEAQILHFRIFFVSQTLFGMKP